MEVKFRDFDAQAINPFQQGTLHFRWLTRLDLLETPRV
jgi:hypothetical protein